MTEHVKDLWDMVGQAKGVLPRVEYGFRSEGWDGAPWHVRRVEGEEALSTPYRFELELVVDDPATSVDPILGRGCELTISRRGAGRSVCGLVVELEELGVVGGRRLLRLVIEPALRLLGQRIDSRAWQDLSAPEIVAEVLKSGLAPYRREVRVELASQDYPRREYCTQFRESDLEFVSRLLEEEGISYYFEHDGGAEVMVLVDHNARFPPLSSKADTDAVPIIDIETETAGLESVQSFVWQRRLRSTAVTQSDFDFVRPEAPQVYAEPGADEEGREREVYLHDEQVFTDDGGRRARVRREQEAVSGKLARGTGNATPFMPGLRFRLVDHRRPELDQFYVVRRVRHVGECPEELVERARAEARPRYANEFECVPEVVPVRPERRHFKPRAHGPTTATVTGPASEEVHTDEHGRIKVIFAWDRLSPRDDTSSWWVRVAQSWAGPGWGSLWLPRIGMEVVVEFLDGDPDRPLVTGCVYNGRNPPPYALPGDKTKSTIKSNSSPSNGGFNELRFEDQAGAEEVFLHAEKDWNSVVKANKTLTVGGNELDTITMNRAVQVLMNDALTVGMNRAETVGMNRAVTVGMNNAVTVGMNQTETIAIAAARTIGAAYQVSVGAAMSEDVGLSKTESIGEYKSVSTGKSSSEDVGEDKTVYVAENSTETVGKDKSIDTGENLMQSAGKSVSVSAGERMTLSAGDDLTIVGEKKGLIVIEDQLVIRVGEAAIVLKKNGDILVSGAKISITGTGDVKVKGTKVAAN